MKYASLALTVLLIFVPRIFAADSLKSEFIAPPGTARPWVYWYFMDGNMSREGITADLAAMKTAGIGGAIFLEVGIGIPRGPVEFMSPQWKELLKHAISEADRQGIAIALGSGPGWCGTGGPWVKPEQSMQHLVGSETPFTGPGKFDAMLPQPRPRTPYFGEKTLSPELKKLWQEFYRDVAVLAVPTPKGVFRIANIDEKALYRRDPFSSKPKVRPYIESPAEQASLPADECIASDRIIDLTDKLAPDGRLIWDAPPGEWTILRFGRTITGQTTRPAPVPGLGLESDKFEKASLDTHYENFIGKLLETVGDPQNPGRGLTTLHFDSWEMGAQNWSEHFRAEFSRRRGYDPLKYLPVMLGRVVDGPEISERFLWDLRQTAQELIVENHAGHLKKLAQQHGMELSIEPYDLNPTADLNLGSVADVPMCEFWSRGFGFNTDYSCIEATSIAHTAGRTVVGAEAFTASASEHWLQHPASMKAQGDWALCCGINRIVFHRYQHQPAVDQFPGMTMGPYGVHWERTQTWWDMVPAYHLYLSRCQHLLRKGLPVADALYLAPEGAPHVFRPPPTACSGELPDRRGYNFDGCDPNILLRSASVRDGRIVFPHGVSYRLLVLPQFNTMTPALLAKVKLLIEDGATVVGSPPLKSPSLVGYPKCDDEVKRLASAIWGDMQPGDERSIGKGRVIHSQIAVPTSRPAGGAPELYPSYDVTAGVLAKMGVVPDFESSASVRYIHRRETDADIYFIANCAETEINATCSFRVVGRQPEWWNPLTGECRDLPDFTIGEKNTSIPVRLDPLESGFVIFRKPATSTHGTGRNFPAFGVAKSLESSWEVSFDPKWGGPEKVTFDKLVDWTTRTDPGIRFYSGKATYRATFDSDRAPANARYLSLGEVKNIAFVRLNDTDLGVVWCKPWRVNIPANLLRAKGNRLEITVANLWCNRLIGDSGLPPNERLTKTTWNPFKPQSPLQPSGLFGPVSFETGE